jgi:hypothetical protein
MKPENIVLQKRIGTKKKNEFEIKIIDLASCCKFNREKEFCYPLYYTKSYISEKIIS